MKNNFITVLFLYLLLSFSESTEVRAQMGLPLVKNYTPDTYKGGIQNWQIIQDERGVIYVANNFGLLQYDGNDWRSYPITGISKLRSIALGSDQRIYTGFQADFGYFEGDSLGTLQYHSLKSLIPEEHRDIDETWKTYIINDNVYFCTFSNIYVYNGDSIQVILHDTSLDISYSSNNNLYTHVPGQGLHLLESGFLSPQIYTPFFSDKTTSGVLSLNLHELLITTSRNGIFISNKSEIKPWNRKLNKLFSETFINCAMLLSNGNIAIGTQNNGIYIIDQSGRILLQMDKDRGLLSRTILSLYEDKNQNLWIGQNNGISFIQMKSPFHQINEEAGLPGTGYTALQNGNNLYLGTNNGVYLNTKDEITLIEGSEGQVYNLQVIKDDVLIGHNNGAFLMKDQTAKPLGDDRIGTWIFEEFNNTILKGTYVGIDILSNDNFQKLGEIGGLNESSRIIVKENDSTVWMSHGYKGVYKISLNSPEDFTTTVTYYNEQHGLPSSLFNTTHLIEGLLKISTRSGIYHYNIATDRFEIDDNLNKYFEDDQISTMQSDIYGNIYFITSHSVGFLEKSGHSGYQKHTAPFNSIRNLLNDDLPNINVISPNLVLFGAKEGFVVFDRNLFWTTEQEVFNTMIRQVEYKGEENVLLYHGDGQNHKTLQTKDDDYPEIAFNDNTLSFYFSSSAFSSTINPAFQYRLVGYDREWQKWTESNYKEYTNLREGLYTFQVKSRNANNVESEVSSYTFIIIYPWYRSPIAYVIYALLAIAGLIGLVLSIDKRHQQEKKKLEQKRVEELSAKEMQISTIAKKSEDQINQLTNEKLESEITHMNTELASNTMHILNKNEFINSIKSNLSDVTKKSTNEEVKKQIGGIIKNIEKNIETDGDWDNFQIHFDKVHGDFSTRIKHEFTQLSPQEIKLSTYLRLNLSTKEIANLLNISVRGVEIGRYRLRKKLNLNRAQNLADFILNY